MHESGVGIFEKSQLNPGIVTEVAEKRAGGKLQKSKLWFCWIGQLDQKSTVVILQCICSVNYTIDRPVTLV
jgi:hypothetical protein